MQLFMFEPGGWGEYLWQCFIEALPVTASHPRYPENEDKAAGPDGPHGDLIMGGSCPTGAEQDRLWGGGALVASLKLALQVQVRHKKQTKNPSTTFCASRASIVVNLISTSMKKLFGRTVGIILQPLAHSRTLKLGR